MVINKNKNLEEFESENPLVNADQAVQKDQVQEVGSAIVCIVMFLQLIVLEFLSNIERKWFRYQR